MTVGYGHPAVFNDLSTILTYSNLTWQAVDFGRLLCAQNDRGTAIIPQRHVCRIKARPVYSLRAQTHAGATFLLDHLRMWYFSESKNVPTFMDGERFHECPGSRCCALLFAVRTLHLLQHHLMRLPDKTAGAMVETLRSCTGTLRRGVGRRGPG